MIEQLLACKTAEQALQLLIEKGWGDASSGNDMDAVLSREEEKTWKVIRDVAPDMSVFDVLSYPKLYHNLKAAIKEVCTEVRNPNIFYDDCSIPGEEMLKIVENKDFARLPGNMSRTAQEAFETLLAPVSRSLMTMRIPQWRSRISRSRSVRRRRENPQTLCTAPWRSAGESAWNS